MTRPGRTPDASETRRDEDSLQAGYDKDGNFRASEPTSSKTASCPWAIRPSARNGRTRTASTT